MDPLEENLYEFRLCSDSDSASTLHYKSVQIGVDGAEIFARGLLARHYPEFHRVEIWLGMKLLKLIHFREDNEH